MKANTIKLDGELLLEIKKIIEPSQSLASYVRGVLLKEIRRHKMKEAADRYLDLLASSEEVREEEREWGEADLSSDVSTRVSKEKK